MFHFRHQVAKVLNDISQAGGHAEGNGKGSGNGFAE